MLGRVFDLGPADLAKTLGPLTVAFDGAGALTLVPLLLILWCDVSVIRVGSCSSPGSFC